MDAHIWDRLMAALGNPFGAAGLMGNLYAESALNPRNLQQSFERKLGYTDDSYTAAVDAGSYSNFVYDGAGYGLAQWTYHTRKAKLLAFARARGVSIGDLDMQLDFLLDEIKGYSSVWSVLINAASVREASNAVLSGYEKPKDQSEAVKSKRATYGEKYYNMYANPSIVYGTLFDDTPGFTGKKLAEYCLKAYQNKWVYWYGTYGQKCSESLYNSKKKQYPDHYGSSRTSSYKKDVKNRKRCSDCVGLIKSYFWSGGDINTIPKYGTNHCPDVSANGMLNQCSQTGAISTIPDEPGLVVWRSGHIGVYVGGGYTVELKGFDYDCQKNKLSSGSWTKWGRLPSSMITYTSEPVSTPTDEGDRFLQNGSKGEDVKQLQTNLIRLGYDCGRWGADGDFGDATESALEAFQRDHELKITGIYDASTISALEAAIQAFDEPAKDPVKVKIVGGNCYVRTEPNTSGRKLGVAKSGSVYNYCGKTSENGWNMINYNGNFAWVSGKYSKLID